MRRPTTRRFFGAWAASSVGNGIGYVALLLLAYETFDSAWAVAAILLADHVPAMVLGPVFGAVADRVPRRLAAIAADALGLVAFAGLALTGSLPLVLALAVVAGVSTALGQPAAMAALPELVEEDEMPAATSLYGTLEEAGVLIGPAVAAGVLLVADVQALLLVNAASFALSALLLCTVRFGSAPAAADEPLLRAARSGLAELRRRRVPRVVVLTSTAGVFAFGLLNVAEVVYAKEELGLGDSGFSILVGLMSLGMTAGALTGARTRDSGAWAREYLLGLALMGGALALLAGAHAAVLAGAVMLLCGYGNGITVVHERLLLAHTMPAAMHGRVYGIRRMLVSWAFCVSYAAAGGAAEAVGTRPLLAAAGVLMLLTCLAGWAGLRGAALGGTPLPRAAH